MLLASCHRSRKYEAGRIYALKSPALQIGLPCGAVHFYFLLALHRDIVLF